MLSLRNEKFTLNTPFYLEHCGCTVLFFSDPLPVLPRFLNTSRNIRVRVGDPALLECLAEGQEKIKFFWYKGRSGSF